MEEKDSWTVLKMLRYSVCVCVCVCVCELNQRPSEDTERMCMMSAGLATLGFSSVGPLTTQRLLGTFKKVGIK